MKTSNSPFKPLKLKTYDYGYTSKKASNLALFGDVIGLFFITLLVIFFFGAL